VYDEGWFQGHKINALLSREAALDLSPGRKSLLPSREAATDFSPGRQPWVNVAVIQP